RGLLPRAGPRRGAGMSDIAALDRDDLARILRAVRVVARASRPLDFSRVLETVFAQLLEVLQAAHAAVYLLDTTRDTFVLVGTEPQAPAMAAKYPELR